MNNNSKSHWRNSKNDTILAAAVVTEIDKGAVVDS